MRKLRPTSELCHRVRVLVGPPYLRLGETIDCRLSTVNCRLILQEQSENVYENKGRLRKPNAQRPPLRAVINSGGFIATERLESANGPGEGGKGALRKYENSGNEAKKSLKTKEVAYH